MTEESANIVTEFIDFMQQYDDDFTHWYVGVASDVNRKLYSEHRVKQFFDKSVWRESVPAPVAREVEEYFVAKLGSVGSRSNPAGEINSVYAYRISLFTVQQV